MCASVVVSICVCARWFQATLKNMNVWDWNGKCRRSGLQCVHAQEHWWAFKIERWPNRTHTFWFRVKKSVKKTLIWAYTLFLSIQFQVSILYFASKNYDLMVDWRFGDGWTLWWVKSPLDWMMSTWNVVAVVVVVVVIVVDLEFVTSIFFLPRIKFSFFTNCV